MTFQDPWISFELEDRKTEVYSWPTPRSHHETGADQKVDLRFSVFASFIIASFERSNLKIWGSAGASTSPQILPRLRSSSFGSYVDVTMMYSLQDWVQIAVKGCNLYVLSEMLMQYINLVCINTIFIPVTCRRLSLVCINIGPQHKSVLNWCG